MENLKDYVDTTHTFKITLTLEEAKAFLESGYLSLNPLTYEDAVIGGMAKQGKEQLNG